MDHNWRSNHCKLEADLCAVLKLLVFTDAKLALSVLGIWPCFPCLLIRFVYKKLVFDAALILSWENYSFFLFPQLWRRTKTLMKQCETEAIFVISFNWKLLPIWRSLLAIKGMWQLCQSLHKYYGPQGFLLSLAAVNTMELYTGASPTLVIKVCISN